MLNTTIPATPVKAFISVVVKLPILTLPVNIPLVAVTLELNVAAPVEAMDKAFVVFVAKFKVFAALKYIPFVGTVAALGINDVAVTLELNVAAPVVSIDNGIAEILPSELYCLNVNFPFVEASAPYDCQKAPLLEPS